MPRRIDARLGEHARRMRREPTPQQARLWQALRASRLAGLKFSRQIVVGTVICDLVCRDRLPVVEIDGDTHDFVLDRDRDHALGRPGYLVLRFTNAEIGGNFEGVPASILAATAARRTKLQRLDGPTHPPAPSLGREGEGC